jgi:hypothetical protein
VADNTRITSSETLSGDRSAMRRRSVPSAAARDTTGPQTRDPAARFPGQTGDRCSRRAPLSLQATRCISKAAWREESTESVFPRANWPSVSSPVSRLHPGSVGINRLSHRDHRPSLTPPVQKQRQEAEHLAEKRISAAGSMRRRSVDDLAWSRASRLSTLELRARLWRPNGWLGTLCCSEPTFRLFAR